MSRTVRVLGSDGRMLTLNCAKERFVLRGLRLELFGHLLATHGDDPLFAFCRAFRVAQRIAGIRHQCSITEGDPS